MIPHNLVIMLLLLFTPLQNKESFTLKVNISNIESVTGSIRVCLIGNDKTKYLKDCDFSKALKVSGKTATLYFNNIPNGKYCAYIYHDENDDKKLDTNGLFGMPSEPYGFSNNPSSFFGPPKLEKCLFKMETDKEIEIELK